MESVGASALTTPQSRLRRASSPCAGEPFAVLHRRSDPFLSRNGCRQKKFWTIKMITRPKMAAAQMPKQVQSSMARFLGS